MLTSHVRFSQHQMKTSLDLLERALSLHPSPYWTDRLRLHRNALHSARQRGNLSPAIAGALAEEMGEDPQPWIVLAALESERESACKTRMVRRFIGRAAAACVVGAVGAVSLISPSPAAARYVPIDPGQPVYYVKLLRRLRRAIIAALCHVPRPLAGTPAAL